MDSPMSNIFYILVRYNQRHSHLKSSQGYNVIIHAK
jgi:hypothetical protein